MWKRHIKKILVVIVVLIVAAAAVGAVLIITAKPQPKAAAKISSLSSSSIKQVPQYNNQIVSIQGSIALINKDYYLTGTAKDAALIKLDFSQSGIKQPYKYLDTYSTKLNYTVTGKIRRASPNGPLVLQVQSIK